MINNSINKHDSSKIKSIKLFLKDQRVGHENGGK